MIVQHHADELKQLLTDLCRIPAPSLQEEKRAEYCLKYFQNAGFDGAYRDKVHNAIAPWNVTDSNGITVIMAHTDTVFPDTEPLPLREEQGRLYCPGAGDDTANVAILLLAAKILKAEGVSPKEGILFVANSGEEGLGNLIGSRALAERYGGRIRAWVSFDLDRKNLFVRAVGSARYRITVKTEGGHSFEDFGRENAIEKLARIIGDLYRQPLPQIADTKTTFNVGTIAGGTSVNTIAQQAEMLYEYRSDDNQCLSIMEAQMKDILSSYEGVSVTPVGFRPGMSPCNDPDVQRRLIAWAEKAIMETVGTMPQQKSASTDCNIPFSLGIPALCFGLITSEGAHTREEWVDISSLPQGLEIALRFLRNFL